MEKFIFAMFILMLIGAYWFDYLKSFKETSDDGAIGKAMLGLLLTACAGVLMFNIDRII